MFEISTAITVVIFVSICAIYYLAKKEGVTKEQLNQKNEQIAASQNALSQAEKIINAVPDSGNAAWRDFLRSKK